MNDLSVNRNYGNFGASKTGSLRRVQSERKLDFVEIKELNRTFEKLFGAQESIKSAKNDKFYLNQMSFGKNSSVRNFSQRRFHDVSAFRSFMKPTASSQEKG